MYKKNSKKCNKKFFNKKAFFNKNENCRSGNKNKIFAKKSLGQNFLQNQNVLEQICNSTQIEGQNILEIGPGQGALTEHLILKQPKKLVLIEKDNRLINLLQTTISHHNINNNIDLLNNDAMDINLKTLSQEYFFNEKLTIIANLPYNIGTTLVMNWMEQLQQINCIVVMLQKEVVERICAKPNSKDYGRISVLIQSVCNVEKLFDVSPDCFFPKPKVISSVIKIAPKQDKIDENTYQKLSEFCKFAFSQRRKKLVNVLKQNSKYRNIILPNTLKEDVRAEEIPVEEYIDIVKKTVKE